MLRAVSAESSPGCVGSGAASRLSGAWSEHHQVFGRSQIVKLDSFSSLYKALASNASVSGYF